MKLLFLSYGRGPHQDEVRFAVYSVRRLHPEPASLQIVICTDQPDYFQDLDVVCCYVAPDEWAEWGGPQNFNHRRKILAMQHLLRQSTEPVVLMDGDVWIRESLSLLAGRIGPGQAVMHIREGQVGRVRSKVYGALADLLNSHHDVRQLGIPDSAWMWNAGVIGLHPADQGLLTDVLALTDRLTRASSLHVLEQFAFSWILQSRLQLSEAADLVFHYWPPHIHKSFRALLPQLMKQAAILPPCDRAEFLYAHRPRSTVSRRARVVVRRVLESLGLLGGYCRCNEW